MSVLDFACRHRVLDVAFGCVAGPCGPGLEHGEHPAVHVGDLGVDGRRARRDRKTSVPNQVLDLASAARRRAARSRLENFWFATSVAVSSVSKWPGPMAFTQITSDYARDSIGKLLISYHRRHAAVDKEHLTVDEVRRRRRQEHQSADQVGDLAPAARRSPARTQAVKASSSTSAWVSFVAK